MTAPKENGHAHQNGSSNSQTNGYNTRSRSQKSHNADNSDKSGSPAPSVNGKANGYNSTHHGQSGLQHLQRNGVSQPQQNGKEPINGKHAARSSHSKPAHKDRPEFPSEAWAQRLRLAGRLLQFIIALGVLKAATGSAAWLQAAQQSGKLRHAWDAAMAHQMELRVVPAAAAALLVAWAVWRYGPRRRRPIYLLDFDLWRTDDKLRVTLQRFMEGSVASERFNQESLDFQERISQRNGLGNGTTCLPPSLHELPKPIISMQAARDEAQMVMCEAVERALQRTGLKPRDIDILVVNCSLFCPTPSLSAMLVNHFHMRSDVLSYNLGGMGCSAGIIAVGLAEKLLQVERDAYALVVSTENITLNWYGGDNRSMLIPNTLFRMGGAAIVLTNRTSARQKAKYQLQHITRVHLGSDETAYRCVYQHADDSGTTGVALDRNLVNVAGRALQANMTRMGRHVLPASEKALFVLNWLARRVRPDLKPYVPDFRRAFHHFCLHAGGRGVIEGLGAQLKLDLQQRAPAAATLHHYGNTSSSTVWYSLAFIESCQRLRRGDIVWQVGFGSGFKCNSAVWKALRPIQEQHAAWEAHPGALDATMAALEAAAAESAQKKAQ